MFHIFPEPRVLRDFDQLLQSAKGEENFNFREMLHCMCNVHLVARGPGSQGHVCDIVPGEIGNPRVGPGAPREGPGGTAWRLSSCAEVFEWRRRASKQKGPVGALGLGAFL